VTRSSHAQARFCVDWKGLSAVTMSEAGVTIAKHRGRDVVRVPYRRIDGSEHNAKLFLLGRRGMSWWETSGVPLQPFGLEALPTPAAARSWTLALLEGESDCLALRGEIAELDGHPLACVGLPGAATWRSSWARYMRSSPRVLVLPDRDEAGSRMAAAVQASVPWAVTVWLPCGEDVRGVLQRDGVEALLHFVDDALVGHRLYATMAASPTLAEFRAAWRRGAPDGV
jgi:hypothetical protein